MKMKPKDTRYRLTGLSIGPLGVSWERIETEKAEARKLITFLEDRRVLYGPFDREVWNHCDRSVLQIRGHLTDQLQRVRANSRLANTLRALRASCRRFLDMSEARRGGLNEEYLTAMGELRAIFGIHVASLAAKYDLEVEDELASIFPPMPSDTD
jgi:hypothetical protein